MAFEYFLYRTDYNNTLVDRGATSFAPLPPNTGEIFINFSIPQNQPLYFYRESSASIVLNDETTIESYLNEIEIEAPDSNVTYGQLTGYTATTGGVSNSTFIAYTATTETRLNGIDNDINYVSGITNSKLNISSFNTYSGVTLNNINSRLLTTVFTGYSASTLININSRVLTTTFNTYTNTTAPNTYQTKSSIALLTGTTLPNTYLTKSDFNTYTGTSAGISTANNGLTKSGANVHLGGSLTGATTIEANSFEFSLTGSSGNLSLGRNTGLINISSRNAINLQGKNVSGVNRVQFRVTSTGATLSDANSTGIQYSANYSAGFTPRSLVDKGYVTGLTTVLLATANNGITKAGTSQNIHLGGALTGATVITSPATGSRLSFAGFPIQYSVDLSANYNIRSLVDRGYVTGITNTLIATANNGITKGGTSQNIHLGGALTGATVITSPATGSRLSFAGFPIQYSTDVSANFNPRSLVDKGYVTGLTSSNVYGTQFQLASDLTSTSTTSTTPVAKVTMNTTSLPAGTYKIIVHWMWQRNSTANSARFNLTIGGVAQGTRATMEMEAGDATDFRPETRIFYVVLSGVNQIIFNHWGESAGNSTTTSDATIELIRVQ